MDLKNRLEILPTSVFIEVFQHKVFRMLLKEGLITEDRVRMILSWRYTSDRENQQVLSLRDA